MAYIDLLVHNKGSVHLSRNTYITIIKNYIIHVFTDNLILLNRCKKFLQLAIEFIRILNVA